MSIGSTLGMIRSNDYYYYDYNEDNVVKWAATDKRIELS